MISVRCKRYRLIIRSAFGKMDPLWRCNIMTVIVH
ncbi:MAG: hypothetical protein JWQ23_1344 [Herminiimonas sp.]|nr:hypothetical protein [Herminiimonas sp.]